MDLLAWAKETADRIEAEAARARVPVAVCIIDAHGNIVLKHRMNGAPAFAIEICERKAYTAALVGLRTIDLVPLVQPGQPLFALMSQGKYCAMGGGAPHREDGKVIAGIGISGGTVEQDVAILDAALASAEPKTTPAVLDMALEVVVLPVADADRAKDFYGKLGWRLDLDFKGPDGYRVIQVTPPGSGCSVIFGKGITTATPGSLRGLLLAVHDVVLARRTLLDRGIEVGDLFHDGGGIFHHPAGERPGPNPKRHSYASFAALRDPDGNEWVLQEVTARLPGDAATRDALFTPEIVKAVQQMQAHGQATG